MKPIQSANTKEVFGSGVDSNAGQVGGDAHGKTDPLKEVINSPDQIIEQALHADKERCLSLIENLPPNIAWGVITGILTDRICAALAGFGARDKGAFLDCPDAATIAQRAFYAKHGQHATDKDWRLIQSGVNCAIDALAPIIKEQFQDLKDAFVTCEQLALNTTPAARRDGERLPDIGPDPLQLPTAEWQKRAHPHAAWRELRKPICKAQAGIPDQMALVWRADLSRAWHSYLRLSTMANEPTPDYGAEDAAPTTRPSQQEGA